MPKGVPEKGFKLTKKRVKSIEEVNWLLKALSGKISPAAAEPVAAQRGGSDGIAANPGTAKKGRPKSVYADPGDRPVHVQFMAPEKEWDIWKSMADREGLPSLSCFLLAAIRDGVILRAPRAAT